MYQSEIPVFPNEPIGDVVGSEEMNSPIKDSVF